LADWLCWDEFLDSAGSNQHDDTFFILESGSHILAIATVVGLMCLGKKNGTGGLLVEKSLQRESIPNCGCKNKRKGKPSQSAWRWGCWMTSRKITLQGLSWQRLSAAVGFILEFCTCHCQLHSSHSANVLLKKSMRLMDDYHKTILYHYFYNRVAKNANSLSFILFFTTFWLELLIYM
jgi:hypothetical protein